MLLVSRPLGGDAAWPARFVSRAGFIGYQGPQAGDGGQVLKDAFAAGRLETVKSLRFTSAVDQSCWVAGAGWWLSTDTGNEGAGHG